MGKIASDFADNIILTNDNPRFENPQKIRRDIKKGIKMIDLTITYGYSFGFPLESLFKLINATKNLPIIKYNSGKGNMYRFFSLVMLKST